MKLHRISLSLLLAVLLYLFDGITTNHCSNNQPIVVVSAMTETERQEQYAARNYKWPLPEVVPNTSGWNYLMRRRMKQAEAMPTEPRDDKYNAWVSVMAQALTTPNFTQYGWAVTKAPQYLWKEIQTYLHNHIDQAYDEGEDVAIVGKDGRPLSSRFVPLDAALMDKALHSLQQQLEAWTGIPLLPQKGYGLRLYCNTSRLYMHIDKPSTHILSCIFHIDHSSDSKPWPLVIEDFEGVTQKVYLQKGDILLYESAKCLHGRPLPFEGVWYTSLFLHYSPKHNWIPEERIWEPEFAVPPHWQQQQLYTDDKPDDGDATFPRIQMVDTAVIEPECPNRWCFQEGKDVGEWRGTAVDGTLVTSNGQQIDLSSILDNSSNTIAAMDYGRGEEL